MDSAQCFECAQLCANGRDRGTGVYNTPLFGAVNKECCRCIGMPQLVWCTFCLDPKRKQPRPRRSAVNDSIVEIAVKIAKFDRELDLTMDNVIVVDQLPMVPPEKVSKLRDVIVKLFSKFGALVPIWGICPADSSEKIFMPMNKEGTASKGFAFLEFEDQKRAKLAAKQANGFSIDKEHVLSVYLFPEFKRVVEMPDEFVSPPAQEYQGTVYLKQWLLDSKCRDQYALHFADESAIYWNDFVETKEENRKILSRKKWSEMGHQWSPHGTYITTCHKSGVRLWGGENFDSAGKYEHENVIILEFSPRESFLVTVAWRGRLNDYQDDDDIIIWDVRTGSKRRGFNNDTQDITFPNEPFKWSHDEQYFAKIAEDSIKVYSSKDMKLLDKKSLKLPGVKDFHWSPTRNIISAYIPAQDNGQSPARVVLIEIPTRHVVRQNELFRVSDIQMFWHPDGTYLAVKVELKKGKVQTSTYFELFRVNEKDIPIEVMEFPYPVLAGPLSFAWEPKGHRFVLLHGDPPRVDVSFYSMQKEGKSVLNLLKTLEKKGVNEIHWSPAGRHVLLAGMKHLSGALIFFNADELQTMAEEEHLMATDVAWDPTGRYVCTYVSALKQSTENGYTVWNFAGKPQLRLMKERLFNFMWRPRPPSLLSVQEERDIRRKLPEYSARFMEEDRRAKELATVKHVREKEAKRLAFEEGEDRRRRQHLAWQSERRIIRGCVSEDEDEFELADETFEEVIGEPTFERL